MARITVRLRQGEAGALGTAVQYMNKRVPSSPDARLTPGALSFDSKHVALVVSELRSWVIPNFSGIADRIERQEVK